MNSQSSRERREKRLLFDSLEQSRVAAQRAKAAKAHIWEKPVSDLTHTKIPPEKLPDPWLFDSESLLKELDRCRELIVHIPTPTNETVFAVNVAIDALWNLRQNLSYLLGLHAAAQREFAKKASPGQSQAPPQPVKPRKIVAIKA